MKRNAATGEKARGVSRKRLIEISRDIVEREGAEHLTIRRIAEAVDRTQPAVYQHFASKDEILASLAVDGFTLLAEQIDSASKRSKTASLAAIANAYVRFGLEHPRLYKVMFVDPAVIPFARASTPLQARRAFRVIADAVAAESGISVSRAETATEIVWAALHGFVMLSITDRFRRGATIRRGRLKLMQDLIRAMAVASGLNVTTFQNN